MAIPFPLFLKISLTPKSAGQITQEISLFLHILDMYFSLVIKERDGFGGLLVTFPNVSNSPSLITSKYFLLNSFSYILSPYSISLLSLYSL